MTASLLVLFSLIAFSVGHPLANSFSSGIRSGMALEDAKVEGVVAAELVTYRKEVPRLKVFVVGGPGDTPLALATIADIDKVVAVEESEDQFHLAILKATAFQYIDRVDFRTIVSNWDEEKQRPDAVIPQFSNSKEDHPLLKKRARLVSEHVLPNLPPATADYWEAHPDLWEVFMANGLHGFGTEQFYASADAVAEAKLDPIVYKKRVKLAEKWEKVFGDAHVYTAEDLAVLPPLAAPASETLAQEVRDVLFRRGPDSWITRWMFKRNPLPTNLPFYMTAPSRKSVLDVMLSEDRLMWKNLPIKDALEADIETKYDVISISSALDLLSVEEAEALVKLVSTKLTPGGAAVFRSGPFKFANRPSLKEIVGKHLIVDGILSDEVAHKSRSELFTVVVGMKDKKLDRQTRNHIEL